VQESEERAQAVAGLLVLCPLPPDAEQKVRILALEQASVLTFYTFQQRTAVEATTVCGYQPALGAFLF
jgi:hypothetical protein